MARTYRTRVAVAAGSAAMFVPALVAAAPDAGTTKTVTFRGYNVEVPASWPVYNLSESPETCVRFDRHAVYLGRPGTEQDCPSHAAGRTEAMLLAPAEGVGPRFASGLEGGVRRLFADDGVALTATYAAHPELIENALRSGPGAGRAVDVSPQDRPAGQPGGTPDVSGAGTAGTATPAGQRPRPLAKGQPAATSNRHPAWKVYTGQGFDTCSAPSSRAMSAWLDSPYRAIGVYIGGSNRACPDGNLSAPWLTTQASKGWHFLPIYVGLQAHCVGQPGLAHIDPGLASSQGAAAADQAVGRAQYFGIAAGSPIYYDMEHYDSGDGACRDTVLTYLEAWTERLHQHGYLSGVYGGSASTIHDLAEGFERGRRPPPDAIWMARWNGQATVWGDSYVPDGYWRFQQRVHQYRGPHDESYGAVRLNIDSDYVDGPVAKLAP